MGRGERAIDHAQEREASELGGTSVHCGIRRGGKGGEREKSCGVRRQSKEASAQVGQPKGLIFSQIYQAPIRPELSIKGTVQMCPASSCSTM